MDNKLRDFLKNFIPVTQPSMPSLDEFVKYLEKIWETKWLTNNGEFHQKLEKELCDYLGVKYISLFTNGTLALITALQELRIAGEVITTPFSFVATTHSLWWNNIKPVFVDIEPETYNIDPEKIEQAITSKTSAILAVHVYGNPCNVEKIQEIADRNKLSVIYDAAHCFGVKKNDASILNYGNLSILSFHATKVFNTFEGGAIICHDKEQKRRIDNLKNFGIVGETEVVAPGINAKMNEIQAAFGLLQLKYIDGNIKRNKAIAQIYRSNLEDISGIIYLNDIDTVKHNYSYFPILIDESKYGFTRDELYDLLKENGVWSRKYFYPLISNMSPYKSLNSARQNNLITANYISQRILCLPIYPDLKLESVEKIIMIISNKK